MNLGYISKIGGKQCVVKEKWINRNLFQDPEEETNFSFHHPQRKNSIVYMQEQAHLERVNTTSLSRKVG